MNVNDFRQLVSNPTLVVHCYTFDWRHRVTLIEICSDGTIQTREMSKGIES